MISDAHLEIDDSEDISGTSRAYKGVVAVEGVSSTSFKTPKLEVQVSTHLSTLIACGT
jgi:hypothetical protein